MSAPPEFVRSGDVDAVAEFRAFMTEQPEVAAHVLAELTAMQTCDPSESVPQTDNTSVRDLYCRQAGRWRVYYTLASPQLPAAVTVLQVSEEPFLGMISADALEAAADQRLRRLG